MSMIKIIATPPGFAPEDIRNKWVGTEIHLPTEEELRVDPPGGLSIGNENTGGYTVFASDAIKALYASGQYEAARYWESVAIGTYLRFKKEVCEVI